MKKIIALAFAAAGLSSAALAQGDPVAGEKEFNKCKSCHMVVSPSGEEIVKGGRTGPNLYGVIGRQAGTYPDFRYGPSTIAAGEAGLVWTEETLIAYVPDPAAFLKEFLGDSGAKSKMAKQRVKDLESLAAFLAQYPAEAASN